MLNCISKYLRTLFSEWVLCTFSFLDASLEGLRMCSESGYGSRNVDQSHIYFIFVAYYFSLWFFTATSGDHAAVSVLWNMADRFSVQDQRSNRNQEIQALSVSCMTSLLHLENTCSTLVCRGIELHTCMGTFGINLKTHQAVSFYHFLSTNARMYIYIYDSYGPFTSL